MKNKVSYIKNLLEGISEESYSISRTFLSFDTGGRLIIDGIYSISEYNSSYISVKTDKKTIGIYGESLVITECSKSGIRIDGKIKSIELE